MSLSIPTMAAIRFGYGLKPGEAPIASTDDLLAQVNKGKSLVPPFPRESVEGRKATYTRLAQEQADIAKLQRKGEVDADRKKAVQAQRQAGYQGDSIARIVNAVLSPLGFHERLASFWVNHFATSANKLPALRLAASVYEVEAIRPHMGGHFADLLRPAILHPVMLIYLDQMKSVGPNSRAGQKNDKGLNENLARELMELHTLGADGGYTQGDVRSAAMLLTGLSVKKHELTTEFLRRRAEPGPITVRGRTYASHQRSIDDCKALLDDLAADPHTARHICRKLVAHFIADTPPDDMVEAMTSAWKSSNGKLVEVYRAMLEHPRAWTDEGSKIKSPYEFVVSGLRALNVERAVLLDMAEAVAVATPAPPDPAPIMAGESRMAGNAPDASIDPSMGNIPAQDDDADAAPVRAVKQARPMTINAVGRMGQPTWQPPSPKGFPDEAAAWLTAGQLAERISWARKAASLFGNDGDPRAFLRTTLADAARDDTIQVVSQAPSKQHGITMVLASPEFNRR